MNVLIMLLIAMVLCLSILGCLLIYLSINNMKEAEEYTAHIERELAAAKQKLNILEEKTNSNP